MNKRQSIDINYIKQPPQSKDLEESVLGAVLLEKEAYYDIAEFFQPGLFYSLQNSTIAEAIIALKNKSEPIDIRTVVEQLIRMGKLQEAGGAYYITQLTNKVASSANVEFHGRLLLQYAIKRGVIHGATETLKDAYDDSTDVFDVINRAEKFVSDLTKQILVTKASTTASLYNKWLSHNELIRESTDGLSGVPSGFHDLDKVTGGWQKSDLIVLAGRPGMGKTALALSLLINAAVKFRRPVAIFSLEMSELQLMARMMAQVTGKNSNVYTRYGIKDEYLHDHSLKVQDLVNAPIHIDDSPAMSLFEMRTKARKLLRDEKIELLIVDYIGIATSGEKTINREQEVSKISGGLKALAKELNIPVIALAQLSRAVETRGGAKEPQLSDLRDSGSVEQDADMVIFIHRAEYYGIMEEDGVSTEGQAALLIRKHRNGSLETPVVGFEAKTTRFYDLSEMPVVQTQLPLEPNQGFIIQETDEYL